MYGDGKLVIVAPASEFELPKKFFYILLCTMGNAFPNKSASLHNCYLLPASLEQGIWVSADAFIAGDEDIRDDDGGRRRNAFPCCCCCYSGLLNAPQCLSDRANTVRRHNEPTDYIVIVSSPQHKRRPQQDSRALSITYNS